MILNCIQRVLITTMFLSSLLVRSQESLNPLVEAYIDSYRNMAIREMLRTGIPVSIKLAQGILETSAGSSTLVRESNNHFGIKCKSSWMGEKVYHDDDAKGECFRKYSDPLESYKDHSDFLRNQNRYAFLFNYDPADYKAWAYGLKQAGYATNPRYPEMLIKYIEDYRLDELTRDVIAGHYADGVADKSEVQVVKLDARGNNGNAGRPTALNRSIEATGQSISIPNTPQAEHKGLLGIRIRKYVYVQKGRSLLSVAEEEGVPLVKLLEWNNLDADMEILREDRHLQVRRIGRYSAGTQQRVKKWQPFRSTTNISSPISVPGR